MNLSTARSARRAREIGVRKAVGATKHTLVGQFIGESALLALGLALVLGALPAFNTLTNKSMAMLLIIGTMTVYTKIDYIRFDILPPPPIIGGK